MPYIRAEQATLLASSIAEHDALRHDYPQVCQAAWDVIRAIDLGDPKEILDARSQLLIVLTHRNAQCRCDPPGSMGEFCTGHCHRRRRHPKPRFVSRRETL